ncbi:MAG: hypothetical protein ACHQ4H_03300 [Ktedonobacterales bacterium]
MVVFTDGRSATRASGALRRLEAIGSRVPWRVVACLVVLSGAMLGVATQVLGISFAATRHPTGQLSYHYQRGYYVDHGWLCYGWSNGTYHCTAWWHQQGNAYISDNTAWVPNAGGQAASGNTGAAPASGYTAPKTDAHPTQSWNTSGEPCRSTTFWVANVSQWSVPPSCYGGVYTPNTSNYVYRPGFGWCNWWPEVMHPNQPDILWGREYHRSGTPVAGAAVFFSPGVQGASWAGHFAQVIAVNPDHYWVLVAEMNFEWRGAGFGRVDYRYIHVGSGVTFIS